MPLPPVPDEAESDVDGVVSTPQLQPAQVHANASTATGAAYDRSASERRGSEAAAGRAAAGWRERSRFQKRDAIPAMATPSSHTEPLGDWVSAPATAQPQPPARTSARPRTSSCDVEAT